MLQEDTLFLDYTEKKGSVLFWKFSTLLPVSTVSYTRRLVLINNAAKISDLTR
jgi:hypothetical protein